jgi:hypothetical protein
MPETTELMKRPKESDELTKKRAWELFEPKVKSYLGADWIESEREYIKQQIMRVLSSRKDGYGMARELERDGWEEDRGLVDLMDDAEMALRHAREELVKQWIAVYGIAPSRKIGDRVGTTNWHRKGQIGTIGKIYEGRAEYGIQYPDSAATSFELIPYEEVIDAPMIHLSEVGELTTEDMKELANTPPNPTLKFDHWSIEK